MPITTALQSAQKHRRELYAIAKRNGLNVRWKMKTKMMESIVGPFKQAKASKIATAFKKATLSTDKSYLDAINQTSGKVNVSLSRFNRIRKQMVSPADKKLLIHIKGSDGRVVKSYHLNDRIVNINNLSIDEENQYTSGADVELNILPTTTIETEWLPNPKRSHSERKNLFRYLTLAEYNLQAFQVYSDGFLIEDNYNENSFVPGESDDEHAANYPCSICTLQGRSLPDLVNQISQTMFNSGATVDFIKKKPLRLSTFASLLSSSALIKSPVGLRPTQLYMGINATRCLSSVLLVSIYSLSRQPTSPNLLWAYNAGFDARFLLKHMSYSSKDTNMIDCDSKIKQAHGFYKKREIVIKDAMSFLAGGLARLPKMFKDASSSLSLEK
ncbi:unnamed protein product [Phytophthora fragariaefolia]|uniref:Unnamed protein product n=1 Tax=Phytophthora fragariaefolia TaxID=1490495 RepID=A0A9W6XFK1_9STRA|nr:unnamed protein product [Phytophthora fragariaefolia]